MKRILIAGGPRVGKTTLAQRLSKKLGIPVRSTDELIGKEGWSEASAKVAEWMAEPGPWIIEGVAVPRAIRKWMAANPGSPADAVYWSESPREARSHGQEAMGKGCATVLDKVKPELRNRGVNVEPFPAGEDES